MHAINAICHWFFTLYQFSHGHATTDTQQTAKDYENLDKFTIHPSIQSGTTILT